MLTFRASIQSFKLDGDLLKTITNYDFNVSLSNTQDQKVIYEFGKEMTFDIKQKRRQSNKDKYPIKLLKSLANMVSGISTIILSSDPNDLCGREKIIMHEKQTDNYCKLMKKVLL